MTNDKSNAELHRTKHHYGFIPETQEFVLWETGKKKEVARVSMDDAIGMAQTALRCAALQTHKEELRDTPRPEEGTRVVRCSEGDMLPIVGTTAETKEAWERHLKEVSARIIGARGLI